MKAERYEQQYSSDKLLPETKKDVSAMAERLRSEGYVFTLEDTADEYVVLCGDKEYHFTKLEQFPLGGDKGATRWVPLALAMEERIRKEIDPLN